MEIPGWWAASLGKYRDYVWENFWKSSQILPLQPCKRERLTLIYDFRVKAFENMINISPSLQALQVIVVSPTKAVYKSGKEDGHACSLLLVSKGWKAERLRGEHVNKMGFLQHQGPVSERGLKLPRLTLVHRNPKPLTSPYQWNTDNVIHHGNRWKKDFMTACIKNAHIFKEKKITLWQWQKRTVVWLKILERF